MVMFVVDKGYHLALPHGVDIPKFRKFQRVVLTNLSWAGAVLTKFSEDSFPSLSTLIS